MLLRIPPSNSRRDDTQQESDGQGHTFGKTRWYVYDGLGSVVGEMDPNGNMTSSPKYDVYGGVRSNPGTASSKMGFVGSLGHLSEAGTGLIYMRARYYDPSNGRFVSEDPGKHHSNWFNYCIDNPVNKVDRTGKVDEPDLFNRFAELADLGISKALNWLTSTAAQRSAGETVKEVQSLVSEADAAKASGDADAAEEIKTASQLLGERIKMEYLLQNMARSSAGEVITADEIETVL